MLVRDQDRVQLFRIFLDRGQAGQNVAPAETGVDEDARFFGADESGISRTAAGENADLNYDAPPRTILFAAASLAAASLAAASLAAASLAAASLAAASVAHALLRAAFTLV
jgi:hypothetical protein